MRNDDALIGEPSEAFSAVVIAFLGRRQQGMQDLDRRLEHFDELEQALRRPVEAAAVGIGVGVGLAVVFKLADVHLADQRGNVLVVLVAGFRLRDRHLAQPRWHQLDHTELGDIAVDFVEPLRRPGRNQTGQTAPADPVFVFEQVGHAVGVKEAEGGFEDGADLAADCQRVDRLLLHQFLQPLGE
ncbi:hypothetical protein D9M70_533600 [compost metagenome]